MPLIDDRDAGVGAMGAADGYLGPVRSAGPLQCRAKLNAVRQTRSRPARGRPEKMPKCCP
jgi:hypothetical protein